MKVDFTKMSDEQILEFVENLSDEEFEALDESAKEFLEKYLDEDVESDDNVEDSDVDSDEDDGEEVSEETKAASTLHPKAGSGGTESKFQTLDTFVRLLQQLGKEDLSHLYNRTVEQIGHEADKVPGSAEKNRATINAKPSSAVGSGGALAAMPMPKLSKEDIDEMFPDDILSEDVKEKASTVFEAALNTRVILERERLEEEFSIRIEEAEKEYDERLTEEVNNIAEELTNKLDQYMDYCVEQWMEKNEIAIENSLRAEIAESFISGLKNLFSEHYVEVPEERLDIVAELKEELDEVRAVLNEVQDKNIELQSIVFESEKNKAIDEVSEGLTKTQVEKMRSLSEGVEFEDYESYSKKLNIIKENYFADKKPMSGDKTGLIVEDIAGTDTSVPETVILGDMAHYVKAISKNAK